MQHERQTLLLELLKPMMPLGVEHLAVDAPTLGICDLSKPVMPLGVDTKPRKRSMSEERLDRIEAALDRQVAVNADLRTSVVELKATTADLRDTTADLRATTEAILQIIQIHQQNFEQLTTELNADRVEWRTQIDRIWQYLREQRGNGRGEG